MRKRLIPVLAAFVLAVGLFALAPAAPASAACTSNQIRVDLYRDANEVGVLASICSGTFVTDTWWGTGSPIANANDALSSIRVFAPAGNTACLLFYADASLSGSLYIVRVPGGSSGNTQYIHQFNPNDTISSSKFSRYLGGNAACP